MKKLLLSLIIIMIMIFLYSYQYPIMSNEEAIASAKKYLQYQEEEKSKSLEKTDWNNTPSENISVSLHQKNGFWNKLTNKMEWEVTLTYQKQYPMVLIDAYTGKLIGVYGPSN
ncbi:PepSY domain-containing protein [Sporosarcina jeotgali]|uniref:PepSY domain-containing protein n=1 Tax=Sporosarcina jeotgali TaxID=3020056 RepID=A0ABZ0KS33_9BACL|nr:PepSY domain-containing protein [Sporosarcina sp. B2O-1]WOV83049.1 PepSY domain-containing protein [Sporosarcina sp. B2O-1]